jgi:hypothetical protein
MNDEGVDVMNDEGGHVSERSERDERSEEGWTRSGRHSVPEKRCQPFTMIPLERWNAGTQRQIPR